MSRPSHQILGLAAPLLCLVLLGCSSSGSRIAAEARTALLGADLDDLRSCAGLPTRTAQLDPRTELLSYELRNENRGGLTLELPLVGGGFTLAGSGSYCHALVRATDGRVTGIRYAGDNDDTFGEEGVCAPILRGCLRRGGPVAAAPAPAPDRAPPG